jgi:hypothetical protein
MSTLAACTFTLSRTVQPSGHYGATAYVTVTASTSTCYWTATSNASWLHTTSSGTGSGTVTYTIDNNYSPSARSGTLTIAGQIFTVNQDGMPCGFTLSRTSQPSGAGGATASVTVTATYSTCSWTATSNASWLHTSSSGTGSGTVTYTIDNNTSLSARSGTLTIAGQTFTVNQSGHVPPVANAGPNQTAGIGTALTFNGSGSVAKDYNSITSYSWAFGDARTGSGVSATHTYSSAGTYVVTLTVTDSWGATSQGSCTVTITSASSGSTLAAASCIWERHFGGTTSGVDSAQALAIKEDHNGNVIVVGFFFHSINLGGGSLSSAGAEDIFVVKYDSNGTYQWGRRFGGTGTDKANGVAIDSNNNIVVAGTFANTVDFGGVSLTSAGSSDIFVTKYDPNGNLLLAKAFGGTAGETCKGVALDSANNIFITGYYGYYGTAVNFGGGPLPLSAGTTGMVEDVFVAKLTPSGGYVWANGYGGTGYDSGNGIAVDGSGNAVIVGSFQGSLNLGGSTFASAGGYDIFVAKYAGSTGAHQWSVSGGGTGNEQGRSVAVDASGNVVVTGEFMGTATIGGTALSSPYSPSLTAMFLTKYSASGSPVWSQGFVPTDSYSMATGRGVAVDGAGNIVLTGYIQGTVGFGSLYLTGGSPTIVLAKFSGSGLQLWAKGYGGTSLNDVGQAVSTGASNNILAAGYFGDPINFGCGSMTSACQADGFSVKVSP